MKSEAVQKADTIQKTIEQSILLTNGFVRKGRNFNRKTKDGFIQVITFQTNKKYPSDPTVLSIYIGVKIPNANEPTEEFLGYYDCTFNTCLGEIRGIENFNGYNGRPYFLQKGDKAFNDEIDKFLKPYIKKPHRKYVKPNVEYVDDMDFVISDITTTLTKFVFPFFGDLDTRDKIVENLEKYKKFIFDYKSILANIVK